MQRATVSDICQSGVLSADIYARQLLACEAKTPGRIRVAHAIQGYGGEQLVAPGEHLGTLAKLHGRLLAAPLALSVALGDSIDNQQLLADLHQSIQQAPFFAALHEQRAFTSVLAQAAAALEDADLLWQHLTLMAEQMPELYRKTLLSVLLVVQLAMEMRLARAQITELFWAALGHDIGMLYIDPAILEQSHGLGLEEWAKIQSHVAIGEQLLARLVALPEAVSLAVYEHQERCDGTGYPLGKVETELSLQGQLLSLADSAVAIYCNRLEPQGRGWRDLIPIIELAAQEYLLRGVELLSALVRRSDLPLPNVVAGGDQQAFVARYQRQQARLQHWFALLKEGLLGLGYTHRDRQLYALQNLVLHLATAYRGLLVQATRAEPEGELAEAGMAANSIQDAWVLQQEVEFHLQRLSVMLQQYLAVAETVDTASRERLVGCLGQIKPYLP